MKPPKTLVLDRDNFEPEFEDVASDSNPPVDAPYGSSWKVPMGPIVFKHTVTGRYNGKGRLTIGMPVRYLGWPWELEGFSLKYRGVVIALLDTVGHKAPMIKWPHEKH